MQSTSLAVHLAPKLRYRTSRRVPLPAELKLDEALDASDVVADAIFRRSVVIRRWGASACDVHHLFRAAGIGCHLSAAAWFLSMLATKAVQPV
ncbi:hypothetical protein Poly41_34840 [Novipirellula artificiosorum]|uniref:Uncharacterized protein n=1 Tax=Novipirellula artificiosorum TaxID=2528016 RepID=A0A5C6DMI4_9BACT|nr:hypothetical protein Poly41_34840 [Novipirellula artificiosorum]